MAATSERFDEVVSDLVATARAHHEATGGENAQWARWYAEHLIEDLDSSLGSEMDVGELEAWLVDADRRYRDEPQTKSWPKAYASWLLAGGE